MIPLSFDKGRVADLLDALDRGGPIESRRTASDYLMLAGACLFAAASHPPPRHTPDRLAVMPGEHREAAEQEYLEAVKAAVAFCANLAMQVRDGQYTLPPTFDAVISLPEGEPPLVSIVRTGGS